MAGREVRGRARATLGPPTHSEHSTDGQSCCVRGGLEGSKTLTEVPQGLRCPLERSPAPTSRTRGARARPRPHTRAPERGRPGDAPRDAGKPRAPPRAAAQPAAAPCRRGVGAAAPAVSASGLAAPAVSGPAACGHRIGCTPIPRLRLFPRVL